MAVTASHRREMVGKPSKRSVARVALDGDEHHRRATRRDPPRKVANLAPSHGPLLLAPNKL